jgi:predicted permease
MSWTDLLLRIRALVHPRRAEQELDEELQFHLEMDARRHGPGTRKRFGSLDQAKEECREIRGTQWFETSLRDIQYALRGFRRAPLFVLTVTGTIALGLGLNAALFTVFNNYVLRPISVRDPYNLYSFTWRNRAGVGHDFSWPELEKLRADNPALTDAVATEWLFGRAGGRALTGQLVSGNYFESLGVSAFLGRTLLPEDAAAPGRDPVMVLSYAAWQDKFARDPNIIGKKLLVRGYPLEVIGVMRDGFNGLNDAPTEYWAPLTMDRQLFGGPDLFGPANPERLRICARLRPGWTPRQAREALKAWSVQVTADLPEADRATRVVLTSRATFIPLSPEVMVAFSPLMMAFGLVLLLACANVANMMLARAMARQREIGIRLSLGAGRPRLIRQLLTESVLLAIPAGLAGYLFSRIMIDFGLRLMFATLPPDMAELIPSVSLPPDIRVFAFMLLAALISALLFGLAPAIQATRADVMLAARGEFSSDVRPMRLRNALVIGQITVCALLLICSGILVRGARGIRGFDVGFKTQGAVELEWTAKARPQVLARLEAMPAVHAMAGVSHAPLNGILPGVTISTSQSQKAVPAWHNRVSPEFFGLLNIRLIEGRTFTEEEAKAGAPVAIVSELAARSLWPKGRAVGSQIHLQRDPNDGSGQPQSSTALVVGVARNIISCSIPFGPDPPLVYLPSTRDSQDMLLLDVRGDVETFRRNLLADLDASLPGAVEQVHSMNQALALNIYPFRVASWVGSTLGGLALLLTLSGIYGVLSYLITQRTKEIGIRMALGATTGVVSRLVLRQSAKLALVGIGIGAALALGVSRLLASHLVFMNTFDLLAYSGGIVLVLGATLAAAFVPTRRAARIDPVTTLRYD